METQLHFDSGAKQLGLCFKERFRTDQGITLKVKGILNTVTGKVDSNLSLSTGSSDFRQLGGRRVRRAVKTTFEFYKPEVCLGGSYVPGSDELKYGLTAKQKAFVGPIAIKAKAALHYPTRSQQGSVTGDICLSQTTYRFTDMQDLQLAVGCHLRAIQPAHGKQLDTMLAPYGVIRENNWSLTTNFQGRWSVLYDL